MESFMAGSSVLKPQSASRRTWGAEGLMLTSLIDAFSILVIFLILSFTSSEQFLVLSPDIELPSAQKLEELKKNTVVKISKEHIFVGEQVVSEKDLVAHLINLRKELVNVMGEPAVVDLGIIIQADRKTPYVRINPVVAACSQAGFAQLHFAALQK